MDAQQPSIGRVVHYVSRGSLDGRFPPACRAATITEVGEHEVVGLHVANPTGLFFHALSEGGAEHDEGDSNGDRVPGSWHWPERV